MDALICNTAQKEAVRTKLIEFLEQNNISYSLQKCCGCDRVCIDFNGEESAYKKRCCNSEIIVQTSGKDVYRIYPHEILYIAIEDRKSVLYLTDRKIETKCQFSYWKDILDLNAFAQPHHSFIVNLNYVDEVTKDFVKLKYGEDEYSVYTSSRKIGAFKKKFMNWGEH